MADKTERQEAKAEAAAEKARIKASRPWYKKKRFIIPLGVLLLIVIAVATTGGDDTADTQDVAAEPDAEGQEPAAEEPPAEEPAAEEPAETTGIGEPAADGNFTFTVNSLECGIEAVGDEFTREEPQGQFCRLSIRVENTGDQAQALFADNQYVLEADGTQHSASFTATLSDNPESDTLFSEINPGNAVEGDVIFDVPPDAEIVSAQLHDSAFSGGVVVNVQG